MSDTTNAKKKLLKWKFSMNLDEFYSIFTIDLAILVAPSEIMQIRPKKFSDTLVHG